MRFRIVLAVRCDRSTRAFFALALGMGLAAACNFDRKPGLDPALARRIAEAKTRASKKPDDPTALLELAEIYAEGHRTFEAADAFVAAIDKGAKTARAYAGLAETYLELGYIPRTVEQLRTCMSIDKSDPDCLFALAKLFQADGSPEGIRETRRALKQVIAAGPTYRRIEAAKAMLLEAEAKGGAETEDEAHAHGHGEGEPTEAADDEGRAHGHGHGEGEPAEAADDEARAQAEADAEPEPQTPQGASAPAGPGEAIPAHGARGGPDDQKVGDLNPFGEALHRAYESVRKNDAPAAEAAFNEALQLRPEDPSALSGLAQALLAQEKLDDAVKAAQRALKADPKDPQARWTYGVVMLRAHRDLDGAVAVWETLLKDEPEYAKRLQVPEMLARIKEAVKQKKLHPKSR